MDDLEIRQKVVDELDFEPSLDAASIGVAVDAGIVTLTGTVRSYAEKVSAEQAALRVKGVRGIAEKIKVNYPFQKKTGDSELAQRAINVLAWDTTIPDEAVKVKVQDGWLTLTGEVQWQYQKMAAETAVRKLSGVTGLSNQISVKQPSVSVSDIKKRIEEALKRDAELEAHNIHVNVANNVVTLEGRIHNWNERYAAERAAWSAPGVMSVADRLVLA